MKRQSFARVMVGAVLAANVMVLGVAQPSLAGAGTCPSASAPTSGDGSVASPYLIPSAAELLYLSATQSLWTGNNFRLTANIDLAGCTWSRIGDRSNNTFSGSLDGGGFTISNLSYNAVGNPDPVAGIFGYVSVISISNVNLSNFTVSGGHTGTLIGRVEGGVTIENVTATGVVVTGAQTAGGLIGYIEDVTNANKALIRNVSVSGSVTGNGSSQGAGIAGYVETGTGSGSADPGTLEVLDSTINVTVLTDNNDAGGVFGFAAPEGGPNSVIRIKNVTVNGSVTTSSGASAGFVGGEAHEGQFIVEDSTMNATVTGNNWVGGVVGYNFDWDAGDAEFIVKNVSINGSMTGRGYYAAGVVGQSYIPNVLVEDVMVAGAVTGNYYVGGLFGQMYSRPGAPTTNVKKSTVSGAITGAGGSVGGAIGIIEAGSPVVLERVGATGKVEHTGSGAGNEGTGGLIGTLKTHWDDGGPTRVYQSYATGNVLSSADAVGGLIGLVYDEYDTVEIEQSFATGSVLSTASGSAVTDFGGLIGRITQPGGGGVVVRSVTIRDVFASGNVGGNVTGVGGLIGNIVDGKVTLTNAYARGQVDSDASGGSLNLGGVLGTVGGGADATASRVFWDYQTSRQSASATLTGGAASGTGKSTSLMKLPATFAAWDLSVGGRDSTKVWGICRGSYPFLMWAESFTAECIPEAPSSVNVTVNGAKVIVTWDAAFVAGSVPVASYRVSVGPSSKSCLITAPSRSCTISGLTVGETYLFAVNATNRVGTGPHAVSDSFVMPEIILPATGGGMSSWLLVFASLMILGGALALLMRRRLI